MASRQIKRTASARSLASEAPSPDSKATRAASPLPPRGSPTKHWNQTMAGVPAVPRRTRNGLENVPPGDSPKASPEIAKYKRAAVSESPHSVERDGGGPLIETSSNRPSPSKRKLEFAKPSDGEKQDQDDKGVRVIIRVRPMSRAEQLGESEPGLVLDSDCSLRVDGQQYSFDTVAGEQTTQAGMFKVAGRSAVENCLAGFNSSIFAYGQTGSGKTHTMTGQMDGSEDRGLTSRVFEHMFQRIQEEEKAQAEKQLKHICKCSFLEIYNEHITDLLEPTSKNLQVREDKKNGIYVEGLLEEIIETVEDVQKLILKGTANRTVAATNMNSASSRSHSVFTCTILSRNKNVIDGTVNMRRSRLNLVDLAGSERQKLTGAQGDRLKEASKINSSLSALGNVIKVLAEVAQTGKQRHVPYRDSRLTYLLQESLGGNAKTVMIANVSPVSSCLGETVSTLKFAQRAKAVQNKAVVNEETTNDVNVLKQQIRKLKDELLRMKTAAPSRSPSPAFSQDHAKTPPPPAASDALSSPSEAVSPDVLELTQKITELSQEALLVESFQGKLTLGLETPETSPEKNITLRRRKQWADVARDVSAGPGSPVQAASPSPVKIRPFSASPEGFEVLADSPGRALRGRGGRGNSDGETDDSDFDEHSDKENSGGYQVTPSSGGGQGTPSSLGLQATPISGGFQATPTSGGSQVTPDSGGFKITPGSEEAQLAYLQKLRFSVESNLPQCVASPDSPNFGRDRRSKFRDPSEERNLLLTPPFTPAQSLESPCAEPTPPTASQVEQRLRELADGDVSKSGELTASQRSDSFFSSTDDVDDGAVTSPAGVMPRRGARQSVESVETPLEEPPEEAADLWAGGGQDAQPPVTPGFGVRQGWAPKEEKAVSPEEKTVTDTTDEGHVSTPDSPQPARRAVTFSDAGAGIEAAEKVGSEEDLQMVVRVDQPVQPSKTSLAGSLAELLGPNTGGLTDVRLRTVEGVLAGALRREQVAEEHAQQLEGELEAMKRIVREYEHDYECNKKLVDCREDKIARLEQLADGVLSESDFMVRERAGAQLERRALQEKIDRHPEVTRFAMENMRLIEQLRRYEDFYGCGEREALQKEVQQLRDTLLQALESGPVLQTGPPGSTQPGPSDEPAAQPGPPDPLVASLQADVAYYKELAEVQRQEAEEAKHTLGGAIVSNAKMASFFEEIQKENDRLLQKHRSIREVTANMITTAVGKYGANPESLWLQAHAAELAALRADESENLREIEALKGKLRDARGAVRTAGELTTRLHNAEERAQACEEVTIRTEQTVKELRRKADVARRQHTAELAAAEQRVREARSKKGGYCQMCQMSERVVFHLPETGDEPEPPQKILKRSRTEPVQLSQAKSSKKGFWFWGGKGKDKDEAGTGTEVCPEDSEAPLERKESMASTSHQGEGGGGGTVEEAGFDCAFESLPLTPQ